MKILNKSLKIALIISLLFIPVAALAFVSGGGPPSIEYVIDVSNADQGVVGNGKTINAYVDAIGTSKKATIKVNHTGPGNETTYTLTTSETIPDNITLEIENGVIIDGAGTLTIEGQFKSELFQVFGSSITVTGLKIAYPEWWCINEVPGTTDMTAAIQAAIDTLAENIFISAGVHKVSSELVISPSQDGTPDGRVGQTVHGAGQYKTIISASSTTANVITFTPYAPATEEMLFNCGLKSLTITAEAVQHTGIAINLFQCSNFVLYDIGVELYQRGIVVSGGQLNSLTNFRITCYNSTSIITDGALLEFNSALKSDAVTYQTPFTTNITNCGLQSNGNVNACIRITACDGLNFSQGYISYAGNKIIELTSIQTTDRVLTINFSNYYIDGVSNTSIALSIFIGPGLTSSNIVSFDNCIFGQLTGSAVVIGTDLTAISFTGCRFINISDWAININSSITSRLRIISCHFFNVGSTAAKGGVRVGTCGYSRISNCDFSGISGTGSYGILYEGSMVDAVINNNMVDTTPTNGIDISGGTFSGTLSIHNNIGTEETITLNSQNLQRFGVSMLDSTSNAVNSTLLNGRNIGGIKTIIMTEASNSSTVTANAHETSDPEIGTFDAIDETWVLMWTGTEWVTLKATCTFL